MNVLITGANGFVGKNLTQRLFTIQDGRDRTRPGLSIGECSCAPGKPRRRRWRATAKKRISWSIWQV